VIGTERLRLRNWRESARVPFAKLNAAFEVTRDLCCFRQTQFKPKHFQRFVDRFNGRIAARPK
jgi:hypothetical protein